MQNRYIQLFICHVLLVVKLGAAVVVTGAKTTTGATGQDVAGYFNESNTITITITLSGAQANGAGTYDMSNRFIGVYVGFSSTTSITISNTLEDDNLVFTKTFDDDTHQYTITMTI